MTEPNLPNALADNADFQHRLETARKAGSWMLWSGVALALLWWVCSGYAAFTWMGSDTLNTMPTGLALAAAGLIVLPGLVLIFAAALARQSRRTHEANLLLISASESLLAPAKSAESGIETLAEATRRSSALINQSSRDAIASLTATSKALEDERLRAESVGYAMADNARELSGRLSEERTALEALSKKLDEQSAMVHQAGPAQLAEVDAATARVQSSFNETDALLRGRIHELEQASSKLARQLLSLDDISNDAVQKTEALTQSITTIEARLAKTQDTIEMAEKASSMAVDAATQTGQALTDAVSDALDKARIANNEITDKSLLIQQTSTQAMEELRKAGAAAATTAARVQEQSLGIAASDLIPTGEPPVVAPEVEIDTQPTVHLNRGPTEAPEIDEMLAAPEAPEGPSAEPKPPIEFSPPISSRRPHRTRRIYTQPADPIAETRPPAEETDLFDKADAVAEQAMELGAETTPVYLNRPHRAGNTPPRPKNPAASEWRDIIPDIEQEGDIPGEPAASRAQPVIHSREETAAQLIERLEGSGIALPRTFGARDKKKIAVAARKDEKTRRNAIRSAAGQDVERVAARLRNDDTLRDLAHRFVAAEEVEALKTLEETHNRGKHASPRLSAYLLVDTALSPDPRA